MIANEDDSLMSQYGIPNSVDTVDVCESWSGSDYQYQAVAVGSSDNDPALVDSVQTITYQAGYATGYTPAGNAAAPSTSVGATAFDLLYADNSTRQASYDNPYYGMSSPDPAACLQPPCPLMSRVAPSRVELNGPSKDLNVGQFTRHGLTRVGIRALLDNAEEIAPSSQGYRRFRSFFRGDTIIRSIDPVTQLLVGEEISSGAGTMRITHQWIAVPGGYVRSRSQYVNDELLDGKKYHSTGTIAFENVSITDPAYPTLIGPKSGK